MDNLAPLTLGVTLLCCVLGVAGLHAYASGRAQREALVERLTSTGPGDTGPRRRFGKLDRRLRRTAPGKRIERKLAATGLDISTGEYVVHVVCAVAALWLIAASVLAAFFGPLAGVIGVWGANTFLNWHRAKRTEAFISQLPEVSRVLANATQAGLSLRTSIAMAADELEAPAGDELRVVADQLAVGRTLDDALDELAARLPSRELVVLVSTLILSNRAGGQVVSSLRNLTITLEERKETRREVRTQLSQITTTAYAVPAIGIGAMLLVNSILPGALDRMTGSLVGQIAVVVSLGLYALGFVAIRRISKIDI
ncbi:type II secretion system F family protein [Streptomyces sp. NBC_01754]|uniref:type II secretion system F family protein n=1 Tax=Streptomyces sp. NBC_01754 TaxID=2975930 RepID=UPI002DDA36C1|nr:type II secretion system F family protein [Streptomyces sp. NBC_01754]WSC94555.1 type II secretion system F family protein [Streptomyces sp. NBC_01754]